MIFHRGDVYVYDAWNMRPDDPDTDFDSCISCGQRVRQRIQIIFGSWEDAPAICPTCLFDLASAVGKETARRLSL